MKNLTKIFMAIVMLAAYSCATDLTNDLGVQVNGGDGQTTLTLSLEESKTQLGTEAEGVYPLLWSTGDQISINGVASAALSEQYNGKAAATFSIPTIAEVYNIAYPAAGEGQVLFAENQAYTAGNIANGATTMYAKCAAEESAHLHHLTAILKIAVVGEATLTHAQISTIDRAPIAGAFAIDFESGAVTATEASKSVINYSFGEGLQLKSEAQYIHVAVPAGVYDELYVTLYDKANGVMYATAKADSANPLEAGDLRNFKTPITYAATDKVVVIKNEADLKAFAAAAATTTTDVVLANDITLTEAWTPIEGYAGTVHGHGYAIKGLTAPLFGTTSASFKGLHLEGVNIVETVNPNVGALARTIVATDAVKPVVESCSAEGTIQVSCTAYVKQTEDMGEFAIGGLVGQVKGVDVSGCVNNVALDVDQIQATTADATKVVYMSVGGVVGYVSNLNTTLSNLSGLENKAAIDVHEVSFTAPSTDYGKGPVVPYIAGVAGHIAIANHNCTVSNLTNRGTITVGGSNYGVGLDGTAMEVDYQDVDPCVAGVVGYLDTANGKNLLNYGAITYDSGRCWFLYLGGVSGMLGANSVLADSENHGAITLPSGPRFPSLHCGGVVAHTWEGSALSGCDNYGGIDINASVTVGGQSGHRYFRIGGIAAFTKGSVTDCHTHQGANISTSGSIGGAPHWQDDAIGGIVGVAYGHSVTNCSNRGAIKAAANNNGSSAKHLGHSNIGGIVGIAALPCNNVTNNGKIIFQGNTKILYLGGCVGFLGSSENTAKIGGYTNNREFEFRGATGDITTTACSITTTTRIGGCVGYAEGTIYNATNTEAGNIVLNTVQHAGTCHIGGIAGWAKAGIEKADNHGMLDLTNVALSKYYVGGISPVIQNGPATDLTNHATGDITVYLAPTDTTAATTTYVSGIGGYINQDASNLLNQGDITVDGTLDFTLVAGVSANAGGDCTLTNLKNEGNILFNADIIFNQAQDARVGGIQADSNVLQTWKNCCNTGDITISDDASTKKGSQNKYMFIGGLSAAVRSKAQSFINCYNTGDLTVTKEAHIANGPYMGGCFGYYAVECTVDANNGLRNTGNLTMLASEYCVWNNWVGGILGYASKPISNAQCFCNIAMAPLPASGSKGGAGMIEGGDRSNSTHTNCKFGGRIAKSLNTDGTPNYVTVWANTGTIVDEETGETITDPNLPAGEIVPFWEVIYGVAWAEASATKCDGCSYISELKIE